MTQTIHNVGAIKSSLHSKIIINSGSDFADQVREGTFMQLNTLRGMRWAIQDEIHGTVE